MGILVVEVHARYEVRMGVVYRFDDALLLEVPYSNRLIVRYRQEVLAVGMESNTSHPVVMPSLFEKEEKTIS